MSRAPRSASKSSRARRRRAMRGAQVRRGQAFTWIVGLVLVAGVVLVFVFRPSSSNVGPQPGRDHWHAALGVYDCDHWMGDSTGSGIWQWPATNSQGQPGRVGSNLYSGLHSHDDGIIHMEPLNTDESGKNATIGHYFEFGGWKISSSGFTFLGTTVGKGTTCNGKPGVLRWETAKFNGDTKAQQSYTQRHGNPGGWKLDDGDVVVIAFTPSSTSLKSLGNPPSLANLPGALGREGQSPATPPASTPPTSGATPTSAATPTSGATPTSAPTSTSAGSTPPT